MNALKFHFSLREIRRLCYTLLKHAKSFHMTSSHVISGHVMQKFDIMRILFDKKCINISLT